MKATTAIEKIKMAYNKQINGNERLYLQLDKELILQGVIAGFAAVARINANEIDLYLLMLASLKNEIVEK